MRIGYIVATAFTGLGLIASAHATSIRYRVTADTTPIAADYGYIDLQLARINDAQSAFVEITEFVTDGGLSGFANASGGASGDLSTTLVINNSAPFNDYDDIIRFGNSISFSLALDGPAIENPNGTSRSISTFFFSFLDSAGKPLMTGDPSGAAGEVTVNLDGTSTATALSPNVAFELIATLPTPEPGSLFLLTTGLILCGCAVFRLK